MNITPEQLAAAKAAYTRYGQVTDFKNFRGDPMPEFEQLPAKIQEAWVAAVKPLMNEYVITVDSSMLLKHLQENPEARKRLIDQLLEEQEYIAKHKA